MLFRCNVKSLVKGITKNSLVTRAMRGWAAIIILVLISMAASLIITQSTDGDAERINVAGSLRMQSYRISQVVLRVNHNLKKSQSELYLELEEFDRRIETPILTELLDFPASNAERQILESTIIEWQDLKAGLLNYRQNNELELLSDIDRFVTGIDKMVGMFQAQTDYKIEQLRLIHAVSISLVIIVAFLALLDLYRMVALPLRELVVAADKARHGELSTRVDYLENDELGLLGTTFNHMASSLEATYQDLESRVATKTHELQAQTESLELLYETSRLINEGSSHASAIRLIRDNLQQTIAAGSFEIYLTPQALAYIEPSEEFKEVSGDDTTWPKCKNSEHCFRIADKKHSYGFLLWHISPQSVTEENRQLIAAVCDLLASAFSRDWKNEQTWRLLLVEERATIARELHDSLAQALVYQKMQVRRWQTLSERGADKAQLAEITAEIRQGLNAAYAQLRELLITFRLKLDDPGLEAALKATAAEYRERGSMIISLNYTLGAMTFRPNAEIHILQIVREALSNVVRHAQADKAEINCYIVDKSEGCRSLVVEVSDNGVGLQDDSSGPMHHGVSIMNERAQSLDAQLSMNNNPDGGVIVRIVCDMEKIKHNG